MGVKKSRGKNKYGVKKESTKKKGVCKKLGILWKNSLFSFVITNKQTNKPTNKQKHKKIYGRFRRDEKKKQIRATLRVANIYTVKTFFI